MVKGERRPADGGALLVVSAEMVAILDPWDFSKTVRERRRALGLTQRELAHAAGLGRVSVLRLENEPEKCQLRTALRVAAVLGLNLDARPAPERPALLEEAVETPTRIYAE